MRRSGVKVRSIVLQDDRVEDEREVRGNASSESSFIFFHSSSLLF